MQHILVIPSGLIYPVDRIKGPTLKRLEEGLRLWQTGAFGFVVVTGGLFLPPDVQTKPAAELMAAWLEAHGVSSTKIVIENRSLDTFENVLLTWRKLREQLGESFQEWTVASHPTHLRRFAITCAARGVVMHPAPVEYRLPFRARLGEFVWCALHFFDPLGQNWIARKNRKKRASRTWRPAALVSSEG